MFHEPVLLNEVIKYLSPKENEDFIDCNLGGGGHAKEILKKTSPNGKLLGIDLDQDALKFAKENLSEFSDRFVEAQENFKDLFHVSKVKEFVNVSGMLFDLGLSSYQLTGSKRGFTFKEDQKLDMRFGKEATSTAAKVLNKYEKDNLQRIFREYGELKNANSLARLIVENRAEAIETTSDLLKIIEKKIPRNYLYKKNKYFAKVFQALRIEVNGEMENLKMGLADSLKVLKKGGRLVVISYHSLEDRIVKNFMKEEALECECLPEAPICNCQKEARLKILTKKVVIPSNLEIARNNKSRSAKLRAAEKI